MTKFPLQVCLFGTILLLGAAVSKGSGEQMCVLTQRDFQTLGTSVSSKPTINLDDSGASAYCVYRGKSGATGGVELDVFYPAGSDADKIANTWKATLESDPGAQYEPENVPGADESVYSLSVPQPGELAFAANAVRRGDLIFSISLPSSPQAHTELLKLSEFVLSRL
jgi:hypothetical protein